MSVRVIAESVCDCCGRIDRQQVRADRPGFTPSGWRTVKVSYTAFGGEVAETTRLLCQLCVSRVQAAMEPAYYDSVD